MANDRPYLERLQDYYSRHHAFPSYSSIGSLLGLRSKSSVAALVASFQEARLGLAATTPYRTRIAGSPRRGAFSSGRWPSRRYTRACLIRLTTRPPMH